MDKLDKIFDLIDHPERYSEQQIKEILADDECRKLYQTIAEVDGAMAADGEAAGESPNIDQEWSRLNRKTTHQSPFRKVAAVVAIISAVGGIALAAIQLGREWARTNAGSHQPDSLATDTICIPDEPLASVADSLDAADTVALQLPSMVETQTVAQQMPPCQKDSLQAVEANDISTLLQDYYQHVAQEKIYIQTDRPYYAAGDTLWFRAHVADALTNIPSTSPRYSELRSRYVYVELYDNVTDSLVVRHKILQDSLGAFSNAIQLSPELPSGRYVLVAYTRWMQNFGEQNFAYQTLDVIGSHDHASKPSRRSSRQGNDAAAPSPEARLLVRRSGLLTYITPAADRPTMLDSMRLVVYGGGASFTIDQLDGRTLQLNTEGLPSGRNAIALMKGRTVIDEHVLVVDNDQATAQVTLRQHDDRCTVTIKARPGVYALSVCDGSIVRDDSARRDIKATLLSDGGVTLQQILTGQTKVKYGFEREQVISGRVTGLFRKPRNARLSLLCQPTGQLWHFGLGNNQQFRISGLEFTDGTRFTIEAANSKGGHSFIGLELDDEKDLTPKLKLPKPVGSMRSEVLTDDIIRQIRANSHLDVWKTIELREVNVSGRHLKPMNRYGLTPWIGATTGDSVLRQSPDMSSLLRRFGLRTVMNEPLGVSVPLEYVGGKYVTPRIFVNDMEAEPYELIWVMNLNPSAIRQIEFFPWSQNAMVSRQPCGALYIFVDQKVWERAMSTKPFVVIQPLGTMPPATFPAQGGTTTFYWNPVVVVGKDGTAEVSFPVHPNTNAYNLHLEGISHDGEIISSALKQ